MSFFSTIKFHLLSLYCSTFWCFSWMTIHRKQFSALKKKRIVEMDEVVSGGKLVKHLSSTLSSSSLKNKKFYSRFPRNQIPDFYFVLGFIESFRFFLLPPPSLYNAFFYYDVIFFPQKRPKVFLFILFSTSIHWFHGEPPSTHSLSFILLNFFFRLPTLLSFVTISTSSFKFSILFVMGIHL